MSDSINIFLPDGTERELPKKSNGFDLAKSIGPGLAKSAVAMTIDEVQCDLSDEISSGSTVSIITIESEEGLEIMRHTLAAQVLASAVKHLYPNAKLAIGPTIEDGFYYDVLFEEQISLDDLQSIESEMKKIIKNKSLIKKDLYNKKSAIKLFKDLNEDYKVEIISSSDQKAPYQIYTQDKTGFIDLCHGPHLPSLDFIGEFKLTNLSGAYWQGDSKNKMLTRIYGTAWRSKKELDAYLDRIQESEKRDHRKLAKEMDLFHFQEDAPGMVFWHSRGWSVFIALENYIRNKLNLAGYQEIRTPEVVDRKLWEASGHWDKYREHMFITEIDEEHANEKRTNALKPMNCPCHVQIYNHGLKSYRDLPVRLSEFGSCHRYEPSGTLHGLMRVRGFTQDDAHIFCTETQIEDETASFISLLSDIYADLGFKKFDIRFSTRPKIRVGDDKIWDQAESSLENAIKKLDLPYETQEGEGAFYGPKLDFVLTDAIGREWQCGTFQADFNLPERLNAKYVDEHGKKQTPVMMHRAILGSFERFIGILIENYSGKLPLWLAPVQLALLTVTDEAMSYTNLLKDEFEKYGIRTEIDTRNEKIGYKIREHSSYKTQLMAIIGKSEVKNKTVSIRTLSDSETKSYSIKEAVSEMKKLCKIPK